MTTEVLTTVDDMKEILTMVEGLSGNQEIWDFLDSNPLPNEILDFFNKYKKSIPKRYFRPRLEDETLVDYYIRIMYKYEEDKNNIKYMEPSKNIVSAKLLEDGLQSRASSGF
jgi:hypothetical protein